jgi:hypothetical protein
MPERELLARKTIQWQAIGFQARLLLRIDSTA